MGSDNLDRGSPKLATLRQSPSTPARELASEVERVRDAAADAPVPLGMRAVDYVNKTTQASMQETHAGA